ncbi:D-alanyl-D-alanine carboxypeptidase family protein [Chthonobacter rhizosphaerae]|uniref:D-alanyl-D-alanine carboxypeptidase family protein n=1 Tax=Chthonobacter rhizosphaerae TaxID=2735553 RepID=UPI0015EFBEE9|nr:D-alanyl-D-alanine carboxypeptidase family protein [Chthonobacter rhizosphaerae]
MRFVALLCFYLFAVIGSAAMAGAVESAAPRALVVEVDTGSVLYEKRADRTFAPANFAKLMTAAVVFDALAAGEITEETVYTVSEQAWRTGGAPARVTTMFAAVKSSVPVGALIRGLIVSYANDAALVLAEGLAGSPDAFTKRMNDLARRIGMSDSRFMNPTGYPDPEARTSLGDVVKLVTYLRTRHPGYSALYTLPEFEWNKIRQTNKTPFLRDLAGTEGLVVAYDEADGFGAVVLVRRDGRSMLVAASGYTSLTQRDADVRQLAESAFKDFARVTLFEADTVITTVRVFGGTVTRVPVMGQTPVQATLPVGDREAFRARVIYEGPVRAPVKQGDTVAALEIRVEDRVYQTVPLIAAADVPVGDLTDRARDGLGELLLGWW